MKYTFLFFSFLLLISCNQQPKNQEKIEMDKVALDEPLVIETIKEETSTIKYIELRKLFIKDTYVSNSSLSEFKLRFKEIDSLFYSIDEIGDGDTITTFLTNGSRFNYFNSAVYFTFLDLDKIKVEYQRLPLNSIHIDSLSKVAGISFENIELSKDSLNNEVKRAWFNIQKDKLTEEQIILIFINNRLRQIQYFDGND